MEQEAIINHTQAQDKLMQIEQEQTALLEKLRNFVKRHSYIILQTLCTERSIWSIDELFQYVKQLYLINPELSLYAVDKEGNTLLQVAYMLGNIDMALWLIEHDQDNIHAISNYKGDSIFSIVLRDHNLLTFNALVAKLITQGQAKNTLLYDETKVLHDACQAGDLSLVQLLLEHGADPSSCDSNGDSVFNIALKKGDNLNTFKALTGMLIAPGQAKNTLLCKESKALHDACQAGDLSLIQLLLEHGADPSLCDSNGDSVFNIALKKGDNLNTFKDLTDRLIAQGRAKNTLLCKETKALHDACQVGDLSLIKLLLDYGANPSSYNSNGDSVFDIALRKSDNFATLTQLIDIVHDQGKTKTELLYAACCAKNQKMLELVLQKYKHQAIDLTSTTQNPLRAACIAAMSSGDISMIQLLLDNIQIDPNGTINKELQGTSLHAVCTYPIEIKEQLTIARFLLSHSQINPNVQDLKGNTPLHYACMYRPLRIELIALLLERNARLDIENKQSKTPLQIIKDKFASFDKETQEQLSKLAGMSELADLLEPARTPIGSLFFRDVIKAVANPPAVSNAQESQKPKQQPLT